MLTNLARFRPRLRLRTLMILVALTAVALGGRQIWRRREYCLTKAWENHAAAEKWAGDAANLDEDARRMLRIAILMRTNPDYTPEPIASWYGGPHERRERYMLIAEKSASGSIDQAAELRRKADDFRHMAEQYRRVADRPWLPIPRDGVLLPLTD